jgi:DNA repair protein RadC
MENYQDYFSEGAGSCAGSFADGSADRSAERPVHYCTGKNSHAAPADLPPGDRPRERLLNLGPQALSDTELLAILLNTGIRGKNVNALAGELLEILDRTKGIPPVNELARLAGLGKAKASAVAAMLEFGRRRWGSSEIRIKHPSDIFTLVRHYADRKQERFISISLNGAHEVLAIRVVTIGLLNRAIVHPREVFADLIQDRAAAFCVAHNHPSGQLGNSLEDDEITNRLQSSADILGLHFMDHLIFSESAWWSYRQNGKLTAKQP